MFDGRAIHSLAVVGKKLCPNVLDECLIWRNWLLCFREQRILCLIYWSSGLSMMLCSILDEVVILLAFLLVWRVSHSSSCKSFVPWNNYLCKIVLPVSGLFLVFLYYFDCVDPMLPRHISSILRFPAPPYFILGHVTPSDIDTGHALWPIDLWFSDLWPFTFVIWHLTFDLWHNHQVSHQTLTTWPLDQKVWRRHQMAPVASIIRHQVVLGILSRRP